MDSIWWAEKEYSVTRMYEVFDSMFINTSEQIIYSWWYSKTIEKAAMVYACADLTCNVHVIIIMDILTDMIDNKKMRNVHPPVGNDVIMNVARQFLIQLYDQKWDKICQYYKNHSEEVDEARDFIKKLYDV